MKIKFNIGKKGGIDVMPIIYGGMFLFIIGFCIWYYLQPTPPSISVTNMEIEREQDERDPTRCNAIVTGEIFNNGGMTAEKASVLCDLGSGGKRPGLMSVGSIEGRSSAPFKITIPLTSCAAAVAQNCEAKCDNC